MGSARGRDNEQPVHVVTLPGFHIARYLVTNAQYAHYVTATDASPPQHWRNGKIPEGREKHPVVYVSWREAVDFCDWLSEIMAEQGQSGRVQLPSEAEWEYAARGIEGRTYPWGNNAPDKGYCNFDNAVSDTTPVGAYPKGATPDGVHDLAGNVWEWTRSKWENYPYPRDEKGRDKREERSGDNRRTLRGCSFRYSAWFTRSACRGNAHPGGRHPRIGFRVVVSPAPSLHDAAPDL
jgi:serine/threonine-protein kinase